MPKKSTAQPRPQLKVAPRGIGPVAHPNCNDVLCGRGGRINSHEGNVQFRDICKRRKKIYLAPETKKLEKAHIAAKLVEDIRAMDPPGRFLLQDPDGMWYDIGDAKAIKKVGQALREDAPEIREELEDDHDNTVASSPNIVSPNISSSRSTATTNNPTIQEDTPVYHTYQGNNSPSATAARRFDFPVALNNIPSKFHSHNRALDALDLTSSKELPHYAFGRPYTSPHSSASTNVSSISGITADESKLRNSSSSGSNRLLDGNLRATLKETQQAEMAAKNSLQSSALDRTAQIIGPAEPFDSTATTPADGMDIDPRGSVLSSSMDDTRNSLRSSQIDVENLIRSNSIHSTNADPGILFQDLANVDVEMRNSMRLSGLGFDVSSSSDLTFSMIEPHSGVEHLGSVLNSSDQQRWNVVEMMDDVGPLRSRNMSSGTAMSLGTFNSGGVQSTLSDLSQEMHVLGIKGGQQPKQE